MSTDFRICSPGETLEKVSPFLSRLGVTRVGRQTGLDRIGIPVWSAYAPNSKAIVVAQGKGSDDLQAKTSAVMEAIERSVATQPDCLRMTASRGELTGRGHLVDSLDVLLAIGRDAVEPDERIEWCQAEHLSRKAPIFVPLDAVHLDRTLASPRFWISSDGLASGNNWHEAALHGLLERAERDACALWDVGGQAGRHAFRIDPDSIDEDAVRGMLERIASAGFDLALFDVTSDLSVACIAALLRPQGANLSLRHVDVTFGAGASLDPRIAAARAISEAVQSRMTFIAGARDDLTPEVFAKRADPAHLQAFEAPLARSLNQLPTIAAQSAPEALERLVGHLAAKGIDQLYAVELAPQWLPVSVVKVLAPQLEHPDGDRRIRFGSRAMSKGFL